MLTATTKSLLSPIADAVSQLIVITAQAELNGSPIPDLRDVAQLVAQHVYSLAEIGHGLIDPAALAAETRGIVDVTKLLKEMTDACAEVRAAGDLLVSVTQTLASDPFSAAGRKQLVEATKGILQGTQRILNTYDDSEIQKSLVVARALIDQSKLITTILASDLNAPPVIKSLLDNARTFAQQSVFLFHLVHARIPELLSPPIQRALTHHSNALDRAAVGTIAALKYALAGSHQIAHANVDLVKRQLKVHARACEGIVQYIVKDDMPEGALGDIVEDEEEDEMLNPAATGLASLAGAATGSRRSLATTSKARIDPVRARIKRYAHALESLAEDDELEIARADAAAAVQQALADIESAPWAKHKKQPQVAAGLLAHAIQEARGAPKDLRELHAKRILGIADHLARQVELAAVASQNETVGAVLSALDQVSACAHELDALAAREGGASDPLVIEAKADELQIAGQAAVQGLKALGLVRAANQIQGSVPTVVSVARSMAESAEDPTAQEANRAYMAHVLGELSGQVSEAREQVVKSVSGDEVVLGLVSHIAENLQAIESSRAKGAAPGNLDRAGASADNLGMGKCDSAAMDQFLTDCGSVAKDMRALDLSESAASVESSAKVLADAANALVEAKKTQDPAQIQAAQDLLDASIRNWNVTLANARRVVAQKANTDSTLGELEVCKEKAIALGGASKAGFADADQDFARATGNACHLLTELVNLPAHANELATLAAQVSLTSHAALDAADDDQYKVLATERNADINQFNAAVDKISTQLAAATHERSLGSAILHIDQAKISAPAIRSAAHGGKPNPIALNKFLHEATAAAHDLKAAGALGSSLELDTATSDVRNAVRDLQATDGDVDSRAHKFASSRLDVALEQWASTADKVRNQAVEKVYQAHVQGVVAELEAAKTFVAALAREGGQNGFKQAAVLAAQALSDVGLEEDVIALKEKAESVVKAAKELSVAKASGNQDAQAAAEVKLQRLVREWNQVVTKAQEGVKVAVPADEVLSSFGTRAVEASQLQPNRATGTSNLDLSQLLASSLETSPNVQATLHDFTAATKAAVDDLNQLDCSGMAKVLAAASDDVASASHALLAEIAAHGPETAQVTSARKSLSFATSRYSDVADKARSTVAQRHASKKLSSALAINKKVFQRLSKATDLEAIDEAADEFAQSADSAALTLRGLGCGNAADQLAALAPLVVASTRRAAAPGSDENARVQRDALLDRWNSTLVAVQEEADGIQAQTQVGSALAALGHAKAAGLELGAGNETGASAIKFALASNDLDSALRAHPALIATADVLKSATNAVVAAANVVADLEAKGQKGTPAHAAAKSTLDRAHEQWTAAAAKAHDDLAASTHQIAKANATNAIESANVSVIALAAAAQQNGDSAASCFKQSAHGAIQGLQSLGLEESASQVQQVVPHVLDAIQAVATGAKSGDATAQQAATQKLESAAAEWNATLALAKDAVVTAVPSQTVLSGLSAQAVHTAQAFSRPLQSAQQFSSALTSASSLRDNVGKLASVIAGLVKAIQHEAENTDDPAYKSKLQKALDTAKELPTTDIHKVQDFILGCGTLVAGHGGSTLPIVDPSSTSSSATPIPSDLLTLIRANIEVPPTSEVEEHVEFKSAVSVLPVTVHNPISESLANLAAEDVVIVEEEAPELLDEEEAKANPIKAVAQELIVQASRWSHQDNDLIATVTNVSQRLHDLAEAYRTHHSPQAQLSLLSSTKEIVSLCGNLQKLSSQLAIACTDRRLRVELVAAANRLPTLSQQLKILASVRASAGPSDSDSERQLVTVAQNLMVVVKDILVKSESASIRVNQAVVAGNVGLAMIKFRRNLFKGRARRAAEASTANGWNDSGTTSAASGAASSKPKAAGLKGLVAGAVARAGTTGGNQQTETASPPCTSEPSKPAAAAAATPTKSKGSFGSLVSAVKSSPSPALPTPSAPAAVAGRNAAAATSSSASSTSASPAKPPSAASATTAGPSLAKRTKSSETFNPASLLSAPPKPPSRPGA